MAESLAGICCCEYLFCKVITNTSAVSSTDRVVDTINKVCRLARDTTVGRACSLCSVVQDMVRDMTSSAL